MEQVRCESKSEIESIFVRLEMTQNVIYILKSFRLHQEVDQTFFIRCRPFKLCAHTHNHNRSTHLTQSQGRSREVLQSRYKIRYKKGVQVQTSAWFLFFPSSPSPHHHPPPPPPFLGKFVENFLHDATMDHHYLLHSHL